MRRRARKFDSNLKDFRGAIHWLLMKRVPRREIAALFGKSKNLVSVLALNEERAKSEVDKGILLPPEPDFSVASEEPPIEPFSDSTDQIAYEVEQASKDFWKSVRTLQGVPRYGRLLQKLSRRSEEDTEGRRLRAKLKHLTSEAYLHAGYAKSAIHFAEEALGLELQLYKELSSRSDLAQYAKTLLLLSRARIQREEWELADDTLNVAAKAFSASGMPTDPELWNQKANINLQNGYDIAAERLFKRAYETFPRHRDFLGFGNTEHARYDVGMRPMALLKNDFDAALRNLETSKAWPKGDIHHAINLNAAMAVAFLTDSQDARQFTDENLGKAIKASTGFGHQSTVITLLAMTPRLPKELHSAWIRFALNYNAYRNR